MKAAEDLLYEAWAVIANSDGFGGPSSEGFAEACVRWRDDYHAYLEITRVSGANAPEESAAT